MPNPYTPYFEYPNPYETGTVYFPIVPQMIQPVDVEERPRIFSINTPDYVPEIKRSLPITDPDENKTKN